MSLKRSAQASRDSVNVGALTLSTHTGTPIDAPYHFDNREATAGDLDVDVFIGPALVVYLIQPERIEPRQFSSIDFDGFSRLLMRTDACHDLKTFPESLLPVDPLVSKDLPTHLALNQHSIHTLEGLALRHVSPGPYDFIGLPLPFAESYGCPVRAVVRRQPFAPTTPCERIAARSKRSDAKNDALVRTKEILFMHFRSTK